MAYVGMHISRCLKEELAWAIDKQLRFISYLNSYTTMKLNYKAVLSLNNMYVLLCDS